MNILPAPYSTETLSTSSFRYCRMLVIVRQSCACALGPTTGIAATAANATAEYLYPCALRQRRCAIERRCGVARTATRDQHGAEANRCRCPGHHHAQEIQDVVDEAEPRS